MQRLICISVSPVSSRCIRSIAHQNEAKRKGHSLKSKMVSRLINATSKSRGKNVATDRQKSLAVGCFEHRLGYILAESHQELYDAVMTLDEAKRW